MSQKLPVARERSKGKLGENQGMSYRCWFAAKSSTVA
jgi:hypothetical protein